MASSNDKRTIYIEASSIAELRISGIGHTLISTINALCNNKNFTDRYNIILLIPGSMKENLERWNFSETTVSIKSLHIEKHLLQILLKYHLLPPMDILRRKGLYLFPNYKNWPIKFSKSITYIYDVAFKLYPETVQSKNLTMLLRNIFIWVKRTDFVITISKTSMNEVVDQLNLNPAKIGVVYCGVDTEFFHKIGKEEVSRTKNIYNIDGEYILFVGNIEPRKNLDRLLNAYIQLPTAIRNKYSLLIVGGGGWLNEDIKSRINFLKDEGYKVINPELYIDDAHMPAIYSGASLLVHPAIHEGFGLPPLEAMSCGTAVAVSDISVMHEILGQSASYFDPLSEESMCTTIGSLLSDKELREAKIKSGMTISSKFNWDSSIIDLISYIDKVYSQ